MGPARRPPAPAIPASPMAIQGLSRTNSSVNGAALLSVATAFAPASAIPLATVARVW